MLANKKGCHVTALINHVAGGVSPPGVGVSGAGGVVGVGTGVDGPGVGVGVGGLGSMTSPVLVSSVAIDPSDLRTPTAIRAPYEP